MKHTNFPDEIQVVRGIDMFEVSMVVLFIIITGAMLVAGASI
jgi:hypothetical protein